MTWQLILAALLGTLVGLSIGFVMTRKMLRELEELVKTLQ
jgi:hypothetical protein